MSMSPSVSRLSVAIGRAVGCALLVLLTFVAAVEAASAAPQWSVDTRRGPTVVESGGIAEYRLIVTNIGDAASVGDVTAQIELPTGLTATSLQPDWTYVSGNDDWSCDLPSLTCTNRDSITSGRIARPILLMVSADPGASGVLAGEVAVSGGGAPTSGEAALTAPIGESSTAFGIADGSFFADVFEPFGETPERQAGAHPHRAIFEFGFNTVSRSGELFGSPLTWTEPTGTVRDIDVALPPGLVGNPEALPKCHPNELAADSRGACPIATQVGVIDIELNQGFEVGTIHRAVFNMVPPKGTLADLAFSVDSYPVHIVASLDPRDYSIRTRVVKANETMPVRFQKLTLWGVPGDWSHDNDRISPGAFGPGQPNPLYRPPSDPEFDPSQPERLPIPLNMPVKPFLTLPSECGVEGVTRMTANSWDHPGVWTPEMAGPQPAAVLSGCERLRFEPSVSVSPTSSVRDAPTGLRVDIEIPQDEDPSGLGTPPLRDAVVRLPEGMTINPASADGLQACSDTQLGLGTNDPITCPSASKIGTVRAESPVLEDPVEGSVYVRSQASDDPQSGDMFRMALVLEDKDRGLLVKLPGRVRADANTGRLETVFDDNPQLPVQRITVDIKDGQRSPLANPSTCGTKKTEVDLSSWAGHQVSLSDSYTITCPGASGFSPTFQAGAVSPTGGTFSPFVAMIDRAEGDQYLSGIRMDMPKGLLAKLKGVELCPDIVAGDGAPGVCPAGSRIGTATVGAGSGAPFYLDGPMYLTGPYKGAPYGLSVQVHAKAGPFDLGMVKVRQALHVDRSTAEVEVVSDPLPQIVKGVPVRLRSADVNVDRPGFTVNPTSCAQKQVAATFTSIQGATSRTSHRFQVGDCQALPFKPRLAMRLTGRNQVRTGRHPGVKAVLRQTGVGEAGIRKAVVKLPKSLALDPDNAQALCEFDQGTKPDLENHCPKGAIVGRAKATTPLLNKPLTGNVYFVKNVRIAKRTGNAIRTLPMIVVALRGEIAINLRGKSSSARGGELVNTFDAVPDAPISRFNLNIHGGSNGILAVTRTSRAKINLCARPKSHVADVDMNGHNGKRRDFRTRVKTPCATKSKKGKGQRRKAAARG